MGYKHILAAVDMTEESTQVLDEARRLATDHKARLSILSVVKPLTQVYGGLDMAAYTQATVNFEREAQAQVLAQLKGMAGKLGVNEQDMHVSIGSPATQIVEVAKDQGADLIVVGSHGRHGLGLLLGSTANGVLHHANCDVLTIRIKD